MLSFGAMWDVSCLLALLCDVAAVDWVVGVGKWKMWFTCSSECLALSDTFNYLFCVRWVWDSFPLLDASILKLF